jgi:hypothetical protein
VFSGACRHAPRCAKTNGREGMERRLRGMESGNVFHFWG